MVSSAICKGLVAAMLLTAVNGFFATGRSAHRPISTSSALNRHAGNVQKFKHVAFSTNTYDRIHSSAMHSTSVATNAAAVAPKNGVSRAIVKAISSIVSVNPVVLGGMLSGGLHAITGNFNTQATVVR